MKNCFNLLSVAASAMLLFSCQKDQALQAPDSTVSAEVRARIGELGFNNSQIHKVDDGYVVEGDMLVTEEMLSQGTERGMMRIAENEQYRTTNVVKVTGGSRTIKLRVASGLPAAYTTYTDAAIKRYNDLNLTLKFQRVTSGGDIVLSASPWYYSLLGILGQGGFPTAAGNPHNSIVLTHQLMGSYSANAITTVIAHEVGHCIGFRHTDYMDRSFSCGGAKENEGASDVGAVYIPGTPTGPDAASWMLACAGSTTNRPFNANDKKALDYVY